MWELVDKYYKQDKQRSPSFPDHIVAQAGVVNAQAGSLAYKSIKAKYGKKKSNKGVNEAAIMTIVKAIRFLENQK